jgi:hypothetical protein
LAIVPDILASSLRSCLRHPPAIDATIPLIRPYLSEVKFASSRGHLEEPVFFGVIEAR